VLGEIPILAFEQLLLDEVNGAKEPDGNTSGKKDEKPKPKEIEGACRWDVCHSVCVYEHDDCEVGGCEGGCETPFEKYVPAVFGSYFMVIDNRVSPSALILGGDFFTGAVLATALV
jgi:coatomer subunit beta